MNTAVLDQIREAEARAAAVVSAAQEKAAGMVSAAHEQVRTQTEEKMESVREALAAQLEEAKGEAKKAYASVLSGATVRSVGADKVQGAAKKLVRFISDTLV